jgi:hypothetical protein
MELQQIANRGQTDIGALLSETIETSVNFFGRGFRHGLFVKIFLRFALFLNPPLRPAHGPWTENMGGVT